MGHHPREDGLGGPGSIGEGGAAFSFPQTGDYDRAIRDAGSKMSNEDLFFRLAAEDIQRAADLFRPVFEKAGGMDGFVSIVEYS